MAVDPNKIVTMQANIAKLEKELADKQEKIDEQKKELAGLAKDFLKEAGVEITAPAKSKSKSGDKLKISTEEKEQYLKEILSNGKKMTEEDLRAAYTTKTGGGKLRSPEKIAVLKKTGDKYTLKK